MKTQSQHATSWNHPEIDAAKPYDVYVSEPQRQVVYRNVLFKAAPHLLGSDSADGAPGFIELEQSSGQIVYIPRGAIVKFCEHGVVPACEEVSDGSCVTAKS
jgi:hypothetical protein